MVTLWHVFAVATLLCSFVFISVVAYWTLPRATPFTFYTADSPVLNENRTVEAGGQLKVLTDFTSNYNGKHVSVNRTLEDGVLITYPETSYTTEKGRQTFERYFEIPEYLPTGRYRMRIVNYVKINPMKTVTVTRYTEYFTIVNNKDKE